MPCALFAIKIAEQHTRRGAMMSHEVLYQACLLLVATQPSAMCIIFCFDKCIRCSSAWVCTSLDVFFTWLLVVIDQSFGAPVLLLTLLLLRTSDSHSFWVGPSGSGCDTDGT